MRRSWIAMVATLSLLALTPLPANASHPHQAGQSCRTGKAGELYISPDGEFWRCSFDERLDLYYWDPIPPPDPDEESDNSAIVPTTEDDVHFIVSRIEWIRGVLYTGGDTYVRRPQTVPLYKDAGQIAVFSRLWWWNGGSWQYCSDSGWSYNGIPSESHTPDFTWSSGSGPCGDGFYGSQAWGAHTHAAGAWLVCGPVWSGYVNVSGSSQFSVGTPPGSIGVARGAPPRDRLPPERRVPSPARKASTPRQGAA